jgi:hypothetical protein
LNTQFTFGGASQLQATSTATQEHLRSRCYLFVAIQSSDSVNKETLIIHRKTVSYSSQKDLEIQAQVKQYMAHFFNASCTNVIRESCGG